MVAAARAAVATEATAARAAVATAARAAVATAAGAAVAALAGLGIIAREVVQHLLANLVEEAVAAVGVLRTTTSEIVEERHFGLRRGVREAFYKCTTPIV